MSLSAEDVLSLSPDDVCVTICGSFLFHYLRKMFVSLSTEDVCVTIYGRCFCHYLRKMFLSLSTEDVSVTIYGRCTIYKRYHLCHYLRQISLVSLSAEDVRLPEVPLLLYRFLPRRWVRHPPLARWHLEMDSLGEEGEGGPSSISLVYRSSFTVQQASDVN